MWGVWWALLYGGECVEIGNVGGEPGLLLLYIIPFWFCFRETNEVSIRVVSFWRRITGPWFIRFDGGRRDGPTVMLGSILSCLGAPPAGHRTSRKCRCTVWFSCSHSCFLGGGGNWPESEKNGMKYLEMPKKKKKKKKNRLCRIVSCPALCFQGHEAHRQTEAKATV